MIDPVSVQDAGLVTEAVKATNRSQGKDRWKHSC